MMKMNYSHFLDDVSVSLNMFHQEPVEEEMKTLTLDEWKAQQKKEGPKFNLRKAGEGSDIDPKWKKATIYKKENEEQSEEEEEETVSVE